jgi:hypothetical protein
MADVVKSVDIEGFDPAGEPEIRVMSDGSLRVILSFMPPSDVEPSSESEFGPFANFDKEMAVAAGVPVLWDDRETFVIANAPPGTVEKVKAFIEGYRNQG